MLTSYHDLWWQFFAEDMGDSTGDIIFPFEMVFIMKRTVFVMV